MRLSFLQILFDTLRFNPRICKRCDYVALVLKNEGTVSIHASVKDATPQTPSVSNGVYVSIHASVKDATYFQQTQPTLHAVSIHASVKDATLLLTVNEQSEAFQSTHL